MRDTILCVTPSKAVGPYTDLVRMHVVNCSAHPWLSGKSQNSAVTDIVTDRRNLYKQSTDSITHTKSTINNTVKIANDALRAEVK